MEDVLGFSEDQGAGGNILSVAQQAPAFPLEHTMMEIQKSLRYRINIKVSTKGQKQWDCTVDGEGWCQEGILQLSDNLVLQLEKRYPITLEIK